VARAAILLCQPGGTSLDPARYPGLEKLRAFLDRWREERDPDPRLLRASGMLHLIHPAFFDLDRGRTELERFVASGGRGPEIAEARAVLGSLPR
jgi:hypothetical protein